MKCPNCGGTLYYDIKGKQLKCRHCSNTMQISEYKLDNAAEEQFLNEGRLYTCRNCGAQLVAADAEAVTYCSYCGSEAILEGELTGIRKPKSIIPFVIDKDACKKIYRDHLKSKMYVPREFKDPEFIERFRPFYIPYWLYQISFRKDPFSLKGVRNYYSGGYDYHEEYDVTVQIGNNGLKGIPFDASRNFDDSIAEGIAPFNRKGMKPYHPGYLAGMYADSPNVEPKLYEEEVLDRASKITIEELASGTKGMTLRVPGARKQREFLDAKYQGEETIFLPVWFLTWRKGDRVAYAVVNGQTGKMHLDLPADMSQFLIFTFIGAAALFAALSLFVTVTSRFVIWFAALLVYLVSRGYLKELRQIRDRENHVFDKGYLLEDGDRLPMSEKARTRARNRKKLLGSFGSILMMVIVASIGFTFTFGLIGGLYDVLVSQTGAIAMTFIIAILQVFVFFKTLNVTRHLTHKRSLLFTLLAMASIVYSFLVAVSEPVQDWWYYMGGLANLAAGSLMCVDLLIRYNEASTRSLPSFYARKGGNDRA